MHSRQLHKTGAISWYFQKNVFSFVYFSNSEYGISLCAGFKLLPHQTTFFVSFNTIFLYIKK